MSTLGKAITRWQALTECARTEYVGELEHAADEARHFPENAEALEIVDAAVALLRAAGGDVPVVESKTLYGEAPDSPCVFCGHVEPHTLRDSTSATHRQGCSRLGCGCNASERVSQ